MAPFKDELEKDVQPGPSANPLLSRTQNVQLPPSSVEDTPPNQAATTPSRDRTYLDRGSKVNGKLSFGEAGSD